MRIYLIEDDEIYSAFIEKSLKQDPSYEVSSFSSAEDALRAADASWPDVFIIDYGLPGMNGIDFYEVIKPKLTPQQKVVMLSALDDGNMVLRFIQKGVRDYVIKDETVIESLKAVLDGKEDDYYLFS